MLHAVEIFIIFKEYKIIDLRKILSEIFAVHILNNFPNFYWQISVRL